MKLEQCKLFMHVQAKLINPSQKLSDVLSYDTYNTDMRIINRYAPYGFNDETGDSLLFDTVNVVFGNGSDQNYELEYLEYEYNNDILSIPLSITVSIDKLESMESLTIKEFSVEFCNVYEQLYSEECKIKIVSIDYELFQDE